MEYERREAKGSKKKKYLQKTDRSRENFKQKTKKEEEEDMRKQKEKINETGKRLTATCACRVLGEGEKACSS